MLNILANERLKLKRNRLLPVCALIAIVIPVFMILVDLSQKESIIATMTEIRWLQRLIIPVQVILYPVLSGFVITFLIQKEYVERTMINTLTAPTSRTKFLFGKYIVWTIWVVIINIIFVIVTCIGGYFIFGNIHFQDLAFKILELAIKTGILNLLSMTPILIVCILQRKTFYPSLLFSCLISGVGFVGLYLSANIRNLIPWSAVTSISILDDRSVLPYMAIFICYLMGLILSSYTIKKQNL